MVTMSDAVTADTRPTTRDRALIPERYLWNLDDIFQGWEDWQQGLDSLQLLMERYWPSVDCRTSSASCSTGSTNTLG